MDIYSAEDLDALVAFATKLAENQRTAIRQKAASYGLLGAQSIGDTAGQILGAKTPDYVQRDTFVVPEGHEAVMDEEGRATGETRPVLEPSAPAAPRERGKPSPGHARRTKAEIAEDEAAGNEMLTPEVKIVPATETDQPVAQDSPETQAADAADEAAETEAARDPAKPLTLDDVRNKLGDYVAKYGMAAAQADGPVLIAKVLGVEPDPKAPRKISDLGDDQAILKRAVDGVSEMIAKNPFKREAVAS